jgi:hypothetical protein
MLAEHATPSAKDGEHSKSGRDGLRSCMHAQAQREWEFARSNMGRLEPKENDGGQGLVRASGRQCTHTHDRA